MKKNFFPAFLAAVFISIPVCAAATEETKDIPLVTYSDIQTGKYNNQKVYIEAVVDNMSVSSETCCSFSLWYPNGDSYFYEDFNGSSSYDAGPGSAESYFTSFKNGDLIRFGTEVYGDGSFGTSQTFDAQLIEQVDVNAIRTSYKSNCAYLPYEDALRTPDNLLKNVYKISGSVYQIINESEYSAKYLISTDNGYVYADWGEDQEVRGSRFLENDSVTLYGEFYGLNTYTALLGENTVPGIDVHFMDLN